MWATFPLSPWKRQECLSCCVQSPGQPAGPSPSSHLGRSCPQAGPPRDPDRVDPLGPAGMLLVKVLLLGPQTPGQRWLEPCDPHLFMRSAALGQHDTRGGDRERDRPSAPWASSPPGATASSPALLSPGRAVSSARCSLPICPLPAPENAAQGLIWNSDSHTGCRVWGADSADRRQAQGFDRRGRAW